MLQIAVSVDKTESGIVDSCFAMPTNEDTKL